MEVTNPDLNTGISVRVIDDALMRLVVAYLRGRPGEVETILHELGESFLDKVRGEYGRAAPPDIKMYLADVLEGRI